MRPVICACQFLSVRATSRWRTLFCVNPTKLAIVFASALTLLAVDQAAAQSPNQVEKAVDSGGRDRFTFGASIGRGSIAIDCPICDDVAPLTEGLSLSVHGGYMLTPRFAILGEYWSVRYNNRGSDWFPDSRDHAVLQHIVTVSGQLWLTKQLYVRAGLGVGRHSSDSLYTKPDVYESDDALLRAQRGMGTGERSTGVNASATTFGVGFEFAHTKNFAADVQLRIGRTDTNESKFSVTNTALTFGVAWY